MDSVLSVSSTIESRVESVDAAEDSIRRFAQDVGFGESDQYFIGLAAREILINAVKHGNHFDHTKKVGIQLSQNGDSMVLEVNDEGKGFQLDSVPDPRAPENIERRSGRGLALALAIMDEFYVEKHPTGTHIRMIKHLKQS